MISKLICALFGHAPLTNVLGRTGYADVCGTAFDGIKRGHLYLTADCPRCGATYSICNVHAYAEPEVRPASSVPDWWKLVPIEPTQEMLDAGEDTFVSSLSGTPTSSPIAVYRAMLAAAPDAKP